MQINIELAKPYTAKASPIEINRLNFGNSKLLPPKKDCFTLNFKGTIEKLDNKELTKTIKNAVQEHSDLYGVEATCFNIPGQQDIILRTNTKSLPEIKAQKALYKLIPIKYQNKEHKNNKNLGLPLFVVTEDNSNIAKKKSISPRNAFSDDTKKMWILRKVNGISPSDGYVDKLDAMFGLTHENSNHTRNYARIWNHLLDSKDNEEAVNFLESCKKCSNSIDLCNKKFENADIFYNDYKNFTKSYLNEIEKIANLPQETLDKAISDIKNREKELKFDMSNINNVLIDHDEKSINFVDLQLNPDDDYWNSLSTEELINDFALLLMGSHCNILARRPHDYLIYKKDQNRLKKAAKTLENKLNTACQNENINWNRKEFLENYCNFDFKRPKTFLHKIYLTKF